MKPRVEAGLGGEERRQAARRRRRSASRCGARRSRRPRRSRAPSRRRRARPARRGSCRRRRCIVVAAVGDEDERVVGDGVGLAHEHERRVAHLIEARADDLRLAAQAVRILHAVVALEMRAPDRAAGEQRAVVARDVDLARLAAQRVDARIERAVAAARRIDASSRPTTSAASSTGSNASSACERERGRDLRAVDEREPFLGRERERRDAGAAQHVGRGRALAVDDDSPSPISASVRCASGARSPDAPTEPCDGTNGTRPALCTATSVSTTTSRTPEWPRARLAALSASTRRTTGRAKRRADADAVRADQVELQLGEVGARRCACRRACRSRC